MGLVDHENTEKYSEETKSVAQEAEEVINGERAQAYGDMKESFSNIAKMWSVIAKTEITPEQVGLMMIALKLCRENNRHKRDNLTDVCGYALCVERITETQIQQKPIGSQDRK